MAEEISGYTHTVFDDATVVCTVVCTIDEAVPPVLLLQIKEAGSSLFPAEGSCRLRATSIISVHS